MIPTQFAFLALTALAGAVDQAKLCKLALDVVFVQDATVTMEDDLPNIIKRIPSITSSILDESPGSHFGLMIFRDKHTRGYECTQLRGKLSSDPEHLIRAYSDITTMGDTSIPEDPYEGIINAIHDKEMGWRPLNRNETSDEYAGARVMILHTDAVPHQPGDDDDLRLYPDDVSSLDAEQLCYRYDYPSDEQVKRELQNFSTHLIILTPKDRDITSRWRDINEKLLGQPSEFYQFISSDSSDVADKITAAIASFVEVACKETTTTTTTTTTIPTTTTTTTTTTKPTTTTTTTKPTTTTTTTMSTIRPLKPTAVPSSTTTTDTACPTTTTADCPTDSTTDACHTRCKGCRCGGPVIDINIKVN